MLTTSLEEYLKTIYVFKKNGEKIQVTKIANKMGLTKPSVNRALKVLKTERLINYEAYGDIELTLKGEELAKKILEAYDIVYVFLTEILEVPKEEAKEEAVNVKCDYDINNEKCRNCTRKNLSKKRETASNCPQ